MVTWYFLMQYHACLHFVILRRWIIPEVLTHLFQRDHQMRISLGWFDIVHHFTSIQQKKLGECVGK